MIHILLIAIFSVQIASAEAGAAAPTKAEIKEREKAERYQNNLREKEEKEREKEREKEKEKKEKKRKAAEAQLIANPSMQVAREIEYQYGWHSNDSNSDDSNFETPPVAFSGVSKDWIVLVNTHNEDKLHLGAADQQRFTPGIHRSLKWATPYQFLAGCIKNVNQIHDKAALPLAWSSGKLRPFVTFIILPQGTRLIFKPGLAKDQTIAAEVRYGGGFQMRLFDLPQGAILLTEKLFDEKKQDLAKPKGQKEMSLSDKLKNAIEQWNIKNEKNPKLQIPIRIVNFYGSCATTNFEWFNREFFNQTALPVGAAPLAPAMP